MLTSRVGWGAMVWLVGFGCGGERPVSAFPTTDSACLAAAHTRADAGLPALPAAAPGSLPPPRTVPANLVEGKRISGARLVYPDNETNSEMRRAHVRETRPEFKLCLDAAGVPEKVEMLRSSCFPRYDAKINATMRDWRYSPYMIDGVGARVCTSITFVFRTSPE